MFKKDAVRKDMFNKRANLKSSEVNISSLIIAQNAYDFIKKHSFYSVALYMSINNEVKIELLLGKVKYDDINISLPYYSEGLDMCFYEFRDASNLISGDHGILYPENAKKTEIGEIDAFFVPGAAFDAIGNRIGYGKGCYDKALTNAKKGSLFIGVCYNFQVFNANEFEIYTNDVKMNYLINECGIVSCESTEV